MIYLASHRNTKDGAGARGGFLIDATSSIQAWEVAHFVTQRVLRLPAETAFEIAPVAVNQESIRCEVVRQMAFTMSPKKGIPTMGIKKAIAIAMMKDPFIVARKINAVLPSMRIELPLELPVIEAKNLRYIDAASGEVRSLGPIESVDFDAPVNSLGAALPAQQQSAKLVLC